MIIADYRSKFEDMMRTTEEYRECLRHQKGKTIGIIYIFKGESAPGYRHYECWEGDVISSWLHAVEELGCLPLLMDARTFCDKTMNGTLPHLDYVVNLNNGTYDISTLGLITSVCAFHGIPCIPCNTSTIVTGENKRISNLLAKMIGLQVPADLPPTCGGGIIRPIALGSSIGVRRIDDSNNEVDIKGNELYQEFISGYDFTTPILYDPIAMSLSVLPAVLYDPENQSPEWFLGEDQKKKHSGYNKTFIRIQNDLSKLYLNLAEIIGIVDYCRIDARFHSESDNDIRLQTRSGASSKTAYFMEINPMPTIKDKINFCNAIENLCENDPIYHAYFEYKDFISGNATATGFILSCAVQSFIDAKPIC